MDLGTTGRSEQLHIQSIIDLDALLQRASSTHDGATVRNLISDDFTLISSSGRVFTADDLVEDVEDRSAKWFENKTENPQVRVYNGDCAVIVADLHSRYESGGMLNDVWIRFTDTWVRSGSAWKYVSGHASRLPNKAAQ